jgi:hypothetical protein
MKRTGFLGVLLLCLLAPPGGSQEGGDRMPSSAPYAPGEITAKDTPFDGGGSITLRWQAAEGAVEYRIERAGPEEEFSAVATVDGGMRVYADQEVADGVPYDYRVVALSAAGGEAASAVVPGVTSAPQWFEGSLFGVALAVVMFALVVVWYIRRARSGEHLYVRRIAGLEAVEEAVGRATEMGRPVLYIPGTGTMSEMGTIASLNLLGEIAKKTAEFGTQIRVPNRDPVVYTVAREIVKGAYIEAGRPDSYDPNSVFFVVENSLAFAGAINGIMVREKPATNFLMGPFHAESLILAETGASTGAIQIAGTDQIPQLPFFVVACDYTLMGEELYAASAYISREPLLLGALKGEDIGKVVFGLFLIIGTILSLVTGWDIGRILSTGGR